MSHHTFSLFGLSRAGLNWKRWLIVYSCLLQGLLSKIGFIIHRQIRWNVSGLWLALPASILPLPDITLSPTVLDHAHCLHFLHSARQSSQFLTLVLPLCLTIISSPSASQPLLGHCWLSFISLHIRAGSPVLDYLFCGPQGLLRPWSLMDSCANLWMLLFVFGLVMF